MSKPNIYDLDFSTRMATIIKEKGISINSFAQKLGVSPPTISRWMKGEADPTRTNLIRLAETTGINLEWLAIGCGPKYWENPEDGRIILRDQEKMDMEQRKDFNLVASNDETFVEIEDCREVRLSAGTGAFNSDYQEINTTKVERTWLQTRRLKAKDCAMFLVSGESMYPTLKDGEEIIVDRSKRELQEGKIFVLNHNGSMLVKKVQFTYDGVELISDNKDYRPLKLDADEANSLIIIGQVVRGYRDF